MDKVFAIWFRRDLRLNDQIALYELLRSTKQQKATWIAFFYLDPHFTKSITPHHDYFFQNVNLFKRICKEKNIHLHIITGSIEEFTQKLIDRVPNLSAIYFNKDEVGYSRERDIKVASIFINHGIKVHSFIDAHLTGASEVVKKDGSPYQVFTPYFRAWERIEKQAPVKIDLEYARMTNHDLLPIDEFGEAEFLKVLSRCNRKWFILGEEEVLKQLEQFISSKIQSYERKRDFPSEAGTSRISPYLKTGSLSIRTILHMIERENDSESKGVYTFIKELAWREFYNMIYHFHEDAKEQAIQSKYRDIKWNMDHNKFLLWKEGKTGFPLVDAAMRQLKQEGWMHNRMRMVTASFLCKDYLIDWRLGEKYFQEMLIDYDEASNIGGWQWAASVGCDAAPYFRIFNPIAQSKKFDPNGAYIRMYVDELKEVVDRYIHEPWKMSQEEQINTNCLIGTNYPEPTVDHKIQRERAINLFKE